MVQYHFGETANCSWSLANKVSHKPREMDGWRIPSYTFLSGYTSNEDLNEKLEEKEEFRQLEDPLELPRGKSYKIDSCELVQERVSSDPTTSLKKIETKGMKSEMNKLQMRLADIASERRKPLKDSR